MANPIKHHSLAASRAPHILVPWIRSYLDVDIAMIQLAHLHTSFADVVALSCNYPGHVGIPDQIDTYYYDLHLCAFGSLGCLPISKRPNRMGQSVAQ
jgi:hypothetical protein